MTFRLRPEHFEAFASARQAGFDARLSAFLRQQFPESADIPDHEFNATISREANRARGYGLRTERQLATFVVAAWLLGEQFERRFPAVQDALTSPAYTPEEKAEWLEGWTEALFDVLEEKE